MPLSMSKITINIRLFVVCLVAASVGFPIAIISLSKVALLFFALGALLLQGRRPSPSAHLTVMATPAAIFFALACLALTISWSEVPLQQSAEAWAKHAKLLLIPVLLWLIRSERDARMAMLSFIAAQVFLLLSSWLLWLGVSVPWATSRMSSTHYAVFSSYLDQAIMSSIAAALCWQLRHLGPGRWGRYFAYVVVVLATLNVLLVLPGRTGHVILIALISLGIMWMLPKRFRLLTIVVPFLVVLAVLLGSAKVRDRMTSVVQEINSYAETGEIRTSSGERLNYWHRSIESIAQHPVIGSGMGSWNAEFRRLENKGPPAPQSNVRNPHQEYLLWGVEAGVPGILLLCSIFLAVYRDSVRMTAPLARATQSVLVALAIACLFNSSLFDATIGDFFCVVLGILLSLGWHTRVRNAIHPAHRGLQRDLPRQTPRPPG